MQVEGVFCGRPFPLPYSHLLLFVFMPSPPWAGNFSTTGEEDLGKEGRGEDVLGHRGDGGGGMERRENQNKKREEEDVVGGRPGEWEMEPLGSFYLRFLES